MSHLTVHRMAALIEDVLDERGMGQAEFSRLAGVSTKHVNEVLRGKSAATLSTLDYWAYLLGCRFEVHLEPRPELEQPTGQEAPRDR